MAGARARRDSTIYGLRLLILLYVALFITIVSGGWSRLLSELPLNPMALGAISIAVATAAVVTAFVIGTDHARAHLGGEEARPGLLHWVLLYGFMFALSALGTVNSLFYLAEGSTVLQESIDRAQTQLVQLRSAAHSALLDPAQEERQATVNRYLTSLREEIVNPHGGNTCGVGPAASQIIHELGQVLPGFRAISQRSADNACDAGNAEAIYRSYETQARRILDNDPDYVRSGGPQRQAYLEQLDRDLGGVQAELRAGADTLGGAHLGFGYGPAQTALEHATEIYGDERQQLIAFAPAVADDLPPRLEVSAARGLGSISHVIPTLIERRGYGSTWFYLGAAILFDLLLVGLFRWHQVKVGPAGAAPTRTRTDPQFLWINEARA